MIDYFIISLAIGIIFGYAGIEWVLGQRQRSLYYFELAVNSLIYILVVYAVFWITLEVAKNLGLDLGSLPSSELIASSGEHFNKAHEIAVEWILNVAKLRAVLSMTPFLAPLSYVLGSATSWSTSTLSFVATTYLYLTLFSKVFAVLYPFTLFFGATLTPIPRLRLLGSALLALSLVFSVGTILASTVTANAINSIENKVIPSIPEPVRIILSTIPSGGIIQSILETINIGETIFRLADIVAKIAWTLGEAMTLTLIIYALSTALATAVSAALGGVYISLRPL